MNAIISSCGTYRYLLTRHIPCPLRWVKPCLFIMLNPSTADDKVDDPTIRKCMEFAKRHACTQLRVVNLFALRATNPKELEKHPDPIGPDNDKHIEEEIITSYNSSGVIICAWGNNKFAQVRANEVLKYGTDMGWKCLGKNKNGSPKHPLYIPYEKTLELL